jgi:type IV pilus assembly protein PilC
MLIEISKDVSMGRTLYASFAARGKAFPVTFLESVKSGEESGDLVKVFTRLKEYYERTNKTKQKVTSSLMYPMFTLVVAVIVIVIIMVFAVPMFTDTFAASGQELPGITQFVIDVSNFFINYGLYVGIGLVVLIVALRMYTRSGTGAEIWSSTLIAIPVVGKIIQLSAASQFAHTMSMMLSSGMPILRCIETAGKSVGNYIMRKDILASMVGVEEGRSLGNCLRQSKYLPNMLVEMTAMGESTGTMETTLEAVARFYDNEVEVTTAKATGLLEPAIICILAVVVVLILLAVYLPMFSMNQMPV